MATLPKSVERLINQLSQLPGIGPKTASRLVFYLLRNQSMDLEVFGEAVMGLKKDLVTCDICHNITDKSVADGRQICDICQDKNRDTHLLCVVEEPLDVIALERASFKGRYHVLGGHISPLDGVAPSDLNINSLVTRLRGEDIGIVEEIILATNPNVEGEATAAYLHRVLGEFSLKVSRIARGLPMGGDLEYADELTLYRALEGRGEIQSNQSSPIFTNLTNGEGYGIQSNPDHKASPARNTSYNDVGGSSVSGKQSDQFTSLTNEEAREVVS